MSNLSSVSSESAASRLLGVPFVAPFVVSEVDDSVLTLGFCFGDALGDCFIWDLGGSGERGGALMMAGWGGIWEEGLCERSAMAAR